MTQARWILAGFIFGIIAIYYLSLPTTASECVRAGIDEVHTDGAAKQLAMYCARKFPKGGEG